MQTTMVIRIAIPGFHDVDFPVCRPGEWVFWEEPEGGPDSGGDGCGDACGEGTACAGEGCMGGQAGRGVCLGFVR